MLVIIGELWAGWLKQYYRIGDIHGEKKEVQGTKEGRRLMNKWKSNEEESAVPAKQKKCISLVYGN